MAIWSGRRDSSREHGADLREERRIFRKEQASDLAASKLAETERKQAGETKRRMMTLDAEKVEREAARIEKLFAPKGKEAAKGMTAAQMAKHREGAMATSREQLEGMRNFEGKIINPATGVAMTSEQEQGYVKTLADQSLQFTLGGGETLGVSPETQGRGWAETQGGRRFEIDAGKVAETTPEGPLKRPMGMAGTPPVVTEPSVGAPFVKGVPPVGVVPPPTAKIPGEAAAGLRSQYEIQQQAAMPKPLQSMSRGVSKYLKSNILSRPSYASGQRASIGRTKTTAPLGLRGFMENRYGR